MTAAESSTTERTDEIKNDLKAIERLRPRSYFLRLASLLGVGTFFDGFDAAIIGSVLPALIIYMHIGFAQAGALAASVSIGMFFGALFFGWLSERIGRKMAFAISMITYSLLVIATGIGWNYSSIYAFRLLSGFGLGGEIPVAAALFSEFTPTSGRGLITLAYQGLFTFGLFFAPLTGAFIYSLVGEQVGWRVLFYLGTISLTAGIVSIFALYESPRWLLNRGRTEEARAVIKKLQAKSKGERHDSRMAEVDREIDNAKITPKKTSWTELFSKQYRRRTGFNWVIWFTSFFITGVVVTFLPTEYVAIGHLPPVMSLELSSITLGLSSIAAYSMIFIIDRIGRKPVLLFGYSLALAGLLFGIIEALVYHNVKWPVLLITASFSFVGMGGLMNLPIFLYTAELFPTRMRGWATSAGTSWARIASIMTAEMTGILLAKFLPHYNGLGYIFILSAVMAVIGLVIVAIFGIETKQKLLEHLSP